MSAQDPAPDVPRDRIDEVLDVKSREELIRAVRHGEGLEVDADGIVSTFGRFEAEDVFTVYAYARTLVGDFGDVEDYDGERTVAEAFILSDDERRLLADDVGRIPSADVAYAYALTYSGDGFISGAVMTREEYTQAEEAINATADAADEETKGATS